MVRFVNDDPMGTAGASSQFLQPREKFDEKGRAMFERETQQVTDYTLFGFRQDFKHFLSARNSLAVSQRNYTLHRRVIALRVYHTQLVVVLHQALDDSGCQRGFPAL